MSMELAKQLAVDAGNRSREFHHAWTNDRSKTPRHLRFGDGGEVSYMRDGILTTTNGYCGSYLRIKEFAGENRDQHSVTIRIACDVFDGETQLEPVEGSRQT